jgi:hypothetical protein
MSPLQAALQSSKPVHDGSAKQSSTCLQHFAYAQVLHVGLSSAGPPSVQPGGSVPESPPLTGLPSPVVPPPSLGVHVSPAGHAGVHVSPAGQAPLPLPLPQPAETTVQTSAENEIVKTKGACRIESTSFDHASTRRFHVNSAAMDLEGQRTTGQLQLRYEDVAQDGRVMIQMLPVSLGVIWRSITIPRETRRAMRVGGILPILTRYEMEAGEDPFAVDQPIDVRGGFSIAHSADAAGNVERIFLDMDSELTGVKGRTNLPPPADAGSPAFAGRLRVEHIFTRPFAPAGERKVLSFESEGKSFVPETRRAWRPPWTAIEPTADLRAIDSDFVEDPIRLALGVMHTDSNQHVNSLVYPRFFEEAALRRFSSIGHATALLARSIDIAFRRPSFAGESLRVFVRAYENAAIGYFFGANDDTSDTKKARAFVQMRFL